MGFIIAIIVLVILCAFVKALFVAEDDREPPSSYGGKPPVMRWNYERKRWEDVL